MNKLKQIKHVLKTFDVRDPRAAMQAIEEIVAAESAEPKVKPVLKLTIYPGELTGSTCKVKVSKKIAPRDVAFGIHCLRDLAMRKAAEVANKVAAKMGDGDCPHGEVKESLDKLFADFEREALEKLRAAKGQG